MDMHTIRNMVLPVALSFFVSSGYGSNTTNDNDDELNSSIYGLSNKTSNENTKPTILDENQTDINPIKRKYTYKKNKDSANNDWLHSNPKALKITHETAALTLHTLPTSFDIRTLDPYFPDPFDQLDLGSCTANALAALVQYDRDTEGLPSENVSREYIYYYERVSEGTVDEDSGASLSTGLRVLHEKGVPKEELWPYDISKFKEKPSAEADADAQNNLDLDNLSLGILHQNLNALKHTLAELKRPVALGIMLYSSFESDEVARTGIVPMPNTENEDFLGGHAVLAVGYNDETRQFTIRNSWGPKWGDHGYFYLHYDYVLNPDLACDFVTARRIGKKA